MFKLLYWSKQHADGFCCEIYCIDYILCTWQDICSHCVEGCQCSVRFYMKALVQQTVSCIKDREGLSFQSMSCKTKKPWIQHFTDINFVTDMLSYCRFCLCSRFVWFIVTLSEIEEIQMLREQLQSLQAEHEQSLSSGLNALDLMERDALILLLIQTLLIAFVLKIGLRKLSAFCVRTYRWRNWGASFGSCSDPVYP